QLIRTSRTIKALLISRVDPLPDRLDRLVASLDLYDRVDVVATDAVLALCCGMRTPRLLLSTALIDGMTDDELEAVLRHEVAHLRRWDPLRILLARSLARALAFIPITPVTLEA